MIRCNSCIHATVCGIELKDPCGLYMGYCETCKHWKRDGVFTSGFCSKRDEKTYQHHYCGAYGDSEWDRLWEEFK